MHLERLCWLADRAFVPLLGSSGSLFLPSLCYTVSLSLDLPITLVCIATSGFSDKH